MLPVDLVAGARPNFMKLAPVVRALRSRGNPPFRIVHTGQHYDAGMNDVFFQELGIPQPDVHLDVGSGSHGAQTARILERYEAHLLSRRPSATVVFGDVNSTAACALASVKLGIAAVHVEAGLRSFDRGMPEEINRLVTDAICDLLLVSDPSGLAHLKAEGIKDEKVRFIGNVMIDTLMEQLPVARERSACKGFGLTPKEFGLVTLHRPSNVDDPTTLGRIVDLLLELAARLPLIFPVHPRTRSALDKFGLTNRIDGGALRCVRALPYLDNLSLLADSAVVLTDSGGIQEESSVLGVPCLTLRPNTERPVTVELGTNRVVGNDSEAVRSAFDQALRGDWPKGSPIPGWDGRAGERTAHELDVFLNART